jgi:hypothetical protein
VLMPAWQLQRQHHEHPHAHTTSAQLSPTSPASGPAAAGDAYGTFDTKGKRRGRRSSHGGASIHSAHSAHSHGSHSGKHYLCMLYIPEIEINVGVNNNHVHLLPSRAPDGAKSAESVSFWMYIPFANLICCLWRWGWPSETQDFEPSVCLRRRFFRFLLSRRAVSRGRQARGCNCQTPPQSCGRHAWAECTCGVVAIPERVGWHFGASRNRLRCDSSSFRGRVECISHRLHPNFFLNGSCSFPIGPALGSILGALAAFDDSLAGAWQLL